MIGIWLRLIALLTLIFTLALIAIRALPLGDADLIAFFAPSAGCAAPCFMGIRPGVTTRDQALALLHAQPWVGMLLVTVPDGISWNWNGRQPAFVSDREHGAVVGAGHIDFHNNVVSFIRVDTGTRLGDFYAMFGKPDQEFMAVSVSPTNSILYLDASYAAPSFTISAGTACPLQSGGDLWYSPVSFFLPNQITGPTIHVRGC